jgi:hypothetical protein
LGGGHTDGDCEQLVDCTVSTTIPFTEQVQSRLGQVQLTL